MVLSHVFVAKKCLCPMLIFKRIPLSHITTISSFMLCFCFMWAERALVCEGLGELGRFVMVLSLKMALSQKPQFWDFLFIYFFLFRNASG